MPRSQFTDAYRASLTLLVEAREAAGLTQVELALALRKPQAFVSKVERGVRRIDIIEFCVIARAIGVDPLELLKRILPSIPKRLEI